jgi:ParB-like chromosome segregation protein Spo0J
MPPRTARRFIVTIDNVVSADAVTLARDDLGITPEVQEHLARAAQAIREAIAAVEAALEATREDSDADHRCNEALQDLEGALFHTEWAPPAEH